jgi:hypothetical protein
MSYFAGMRMVLLCTSIAISGALYAQDGVVLINQAAAIAGNVTPGDGPGFPVTISRSGSYRLSSNLVVSSAHGTGIEITAPNVNLDLNGFSIIGPGGCTAQPQGLPICLPPGQGIGVRAGSDSTVGPNSVKVLNGSVIGMRLHGIQLTGTNSLVEKVAADGNAGSGLIVNGSVIESSASANGSDGIRALIVRNSVSVQNLVHGILLNFGGVAVDNVVSSNGFRGIFVRNGSAIGNTATLNVNIGILASCPSSLVDNTSLANTGAPLVTDGDNCAVANNATDQ